MTRKRKREPGLEVELPITPMLDMAFQLFAFFVFMYHPSALEGQMQMNLPAVGEAKAESEADVDPKSQSQNEIKLESELTVIIRTKQDGINDSVPSNYLVETPQGTSQAMKTLEELESYLVKAKANLTNQDDVKIQADGRLKYVYVMEVMDVCSNPKKAGFKHVGFAPPPDLESGDNQ
ncbi:MAG TPA: biopolymer transporter ExbD [Gemmataceae bacterium]|jgi:biopolymer transport protein ExbD|nr:biopolymer transporter ExbD [Gemmataceae bacterium]